MNEIIVLKRSNPATMPVTAGVFSFFSRSYIIFCVLVVVEEVEVVVDRVVVVVVVVVV